MKSAEIPGWNARKALLQGSGTVMLAALLGGCALGLPQWGDRIEVEVVLPSPGASWEGIGPLEHRIVVPSVTGEGDPTEVRVAPASASVRLRITKRTNLPILDYPLLDGRSDLLKPAGGVFPLDLEGGSRLPLRYDEGFLAELLVPVVSAGSLLEALNVSRLRREIHERSNGDPWRLDREAILQTLSYGVMRSDRIRSRPCFDLNLDAAEGTWVCGDPFYGPVVVEPERSTMSLVQIPSGTHRFFRIDGRSAPSERIDVAVDESGWRWLNEATGCGGSESW